MTMRLKLWQWIVLGLPIAAVVSFILLAAAMQIHTWGLSWVWAVFTVVFVGWRWLLARWTQPAMQQLAAIVAEMEEDLRDTTPPSVAASNATTQQAEAVIQRVLAAAQQDPPLWGDWLTFWQRCQEVMNGIAQVYYPTEKRPILNIYVPQAYGLLRGTVDDMDQWMQKLTPALNQVSIGQAYQAYEIYQKLEPAARKVWRVWNAAQWLLNPAGAIARQTTQRYGNQANQQLIVNLGQVLRETALQTLGQQAIALYSGTAPKIPITVTQPALAKAETKTLQDLLAQAEPPEKVAEKPVSVFLAGRTGAGKSSLINTLFLAPRAEVDVLPSTDHLQNYHWQTETGESLILWDTPGYEQIARADLRQQVLEEVTQADLLLLVTPAMDPALEMDSQFLQEVRSQVPDLPVIAIVSQVDRLRPFREWQPPYDWQWGDRPKEVAIREAVYYRAEVLAEGCDRIVPVVMGDLASGRSAWGIEALAICLLDSLSPAKQLRLSRFLRNLEARSVAAATLIDQAILQMSTAQGLTALLKTPVLTFLSTLATGTPTLAYALAQKIPVEELPLVLGKLQLAYSLFQQLQPEATSLTFDLLILWPLVTDQTGTPDRNVWAFGHSLIEYWTQALSSEQLLQRFQAYLGQLTPDKI